MSQVKNTYTQFLDSGAGDTQLHTTPGFILAIIASAPASGYTITFTDTSGSGDSHTLLKLDISATIYPTYIRLDNTSKIRFTHGLKVNPSSARVFIVTEV